MNKALLCPSPPTETQLSSEDHWITVTLGPRGSRRGVEESGLNRANWSERVPWGVLNKANLCPSPPTATRPSSEDPATTIARPTLLGPRGFGRGVEESGPSKEPSWSVRAP